MRIWLKDSERKPDPAPMKTDDRKAVLAGTVLWLLALGALLIFLQPLIEHRGGFWLWTCVVGLAIGLIGLVYTSRRAS